MWPLASSLTICAIGALGVVALSLPASGTQLRADTASKTLKGADTCQFHDYNYCYTETLQLTGAVKAHGSAKTAEFTGKCKSWMADYAKQNGAQVELPQIVLGKQGDVIDLGAVIWDGWKGPGTYPLDVSGGGTSSYVSLGDEGGITVNAKTTYTTVDNPTHPQKVNVTVKSDGSLAIVFQNLANGDDPSQVVSGSAQFMCKDA